VLADDGNGEGAAVHHQHVVVAVENDAARRPQRDGALVIVFRQLGELRVLDDLEIPEAEHEGAEEEADAELEHHQTNRHLAPILTH
jgi:hypothetical protein